MEWYIKAFIRSSLLWFAAGIALGIGMAVHPVWVAWMPAHAHMNVAGFLTMLVFGVGYQLLPRLFGHPLRSPALAIAHLWLANLGLAGIVAGFMTRLRSPHLGQWLLSVGGILFGAGVLLWIWNLWSTFDAADARQRARDAAGKPPLPTVER